MESLVLHTGAPTVHWEDNKILFMLLGMKWLHLESNILILQSVLFKNNFKMVFLLQNIRSLVSCKHVCVPNHVRVQLSVGVLNGLLGSGSTHPVILNTIKSWNYMVLLLIKHATEILLCDLSFFWSGYRDQIACSL